jgi:hypothetical protein
MQRIRSSRRNYQTVQSKQDKARLHRSMESTITYLPTLRSMYTWQVSSSGVMRKAHKQTNQFRSSEFCYCLFIWPAHSYLLRNYLPPPQLFYDRLFLLHTKQSKEILMALSFAPTKGTGDPVSFPRLLYPTCRRPSPHRLDHGSPGPEAHSAHETLPR